MDFASILGRTKKVIYSKIVIRYKIPPKLSPVKMNKATKISNPPMNLISLDQFDWIKTLLLDHRGYRILDIVSLAYPSVDNLLILLGRSFKDADSGYKLKR